MWKAPYPHMATDFYLLDERLTDEERAIRDRLRAFCDREVTPIINDYWERAEFPFELVPKIAELGLAGGVIDGYGCPGMSATAAGPREHGVGAGGRQHRHLLRRALEPRDADRSTCSAPRSSASAGCRAWPRSRRSAPSALTEPDHGSDAVALETSARRDGDEFVLDGAKKWIGNASFADVDDHLGARRGRPGRRLPRREGHAGLPHRGHHRQDVAARGVAGRDRRSTACACPAENRLPGCRSFRDVARVLTLTRYTVAWRALGVALAAYEAALAYAKEREQFGHPLASFQLVQDKLSRMVGEITAMQLLCLRLSRAGGRRAPDRRAWRRWRR